jgi:adenylosuccinate synthase
MEYFDIVLGCSFGDEGKGKVVYDLLTKNNYNLCVRFNGGSNAGHTVYINNDK